MKYFIIALLFLFVADKPVVAQPYAILIKGGHVIDPKNGVDDVMDVAIKDGKIAKILKDIPQSQGKKIIDAKGMYVVPGLIDLHAHLFVGSKAGVFANGLSSVSPDNFSFRSGVTTMVDAGTSGWRSFPLFKEQVIDQSQTRVLAFLNIAGAGMVGSPSEQDMNDMNAHMTSLFIKQYPGIIVGVKIGHYSGKDWAPFDRAIEAGSLAKVPIIVEAHLPGYPLDKMLEKMRPGDIFSQAFKNTTSERLSVVDDQSKVRSYVMAAKERGILFDTGHGGASYHFATAVPAFKQGLVPTSFGTDLHRPSMNSGMKDILNLMSKYLNMGMSIQDAIARATWSAAQSIKREDLGHLSEGSEADVSILNLREGKFGFLDAAGKKLEGTKKLECEMTIRNGKVVYDLNGLASVK